MPVIGTNFKKINVERKDITNNFKLSKVAHDFRIVNIYEKKMEPIEPVKNVLIFEYEFKVNYVIESGAAASKSKSKGKEDSLGNILIGGEIAYLADKNLISSVLKVWKKDKKVEPSVLQEVVQVALNQAQIESLNLSQKVLLPPSLRLPRIQAENA